MNEFILYSLNNERNIFMNKQGVKKMNGLSITGISIAVIGVLGNYATAT